MAALALATVLKILFTVLGCVMAAIFIRTLVIGLPFRKEYLTWWTAATLIDYFINNVFVIGAWIMYKESSNWILGVVWIVLLVFSGSIATCAYIVLQLLHLSPQESLQNPIYFVLLGQKDNRGAGGGEGKSIFTALTARVVFGALGCLMLVSLVYTIATDSPPFWKDLSNPWLSATLIDIYINVITLSVWVAYKESSWIGSAFWIVLLICSASITICAYIVYHLFSLSSQDPAYLVLFSSSSYFQSISEAVSDTDQLKHSRGSTNTVAVPMLTSGY